MQALHNGAVDLDQWVERRFFAGYAAGIFGHPKRQGDNLGAHILGQALKFFGEDQVVFASDAPFDPEGGPMYIRETIRVIDSLEITPEARRKIYQGNAERLFNRTF